MKDIVLTFEVHQPFRIRKNFFWEHKMFKRLNKRELFDYYFERDLNQEVFERTSKKCYHPSNNIILDAIDESKREKRRVKVSFSLSGVFLDQCEVFSRDVLESFRQLAETGCVEFIGQTYYHSLCGLYPRKQEFAEQVEMHKKAVKDLLGTEATFFENTELLYNNSIAKRVEELGFLGIFTEGAERILEGRSPNHMYSAKDCKKLRILLRNYKLTDDIGFRFSAKWWSEWPLTADKYASWLSSTPGDCIVIFPDYETFGEHQWPETGIHQFLQHLLREINGRQDVAMATPSEVVRNKESVGIIDVPELGGTISWADIQRDSSCWLGNAMQWAYYTTIRDMEPLVRESQDLEFTRLWRHLQISDHLYYMYTAGGGPGEVHAYFSPFGNPIDAFVTCQSAGTDFESRLRVYDMTSNEPFKFYKGVGEDKYAGLAVWSLRGFIAALSKVDSDIIEFHNIRGDYAKWASLSLRDTDLANKLQAVIKLKGERLRKTLVEIAENHLKTNVKE